MSLLNKPDVDAINHHGENMKAEIYLSGFLLHEIKYSVNPENICIRSFIKYMYDNDKYPYKNKYKCVSIIDY